MNRAIAPRKAARGQPRWARIVSWRSAREPQTRQETVATTGHEALLEQQAQMLARVALRRPGHRAKILNRSLALEHRLQESLLTIKGEKKQEKEEKDEHYHRIERSYGAFTRSLRLPVAVDAGKVTATVKSGLLTVTLPKIPAARGTTIAVKAE